MNEKTAQAQLYVPQFLLRRFGSGKSDQVYVLDKHEDKSFKTSPGNIAVEKNFYDFSADDRNAGLENVLGEMEANVSSAINRIVEEESLKNLTDQDKAGLSVFAAIQFLKVKGGRDSVKKIDERLETMGVDEQALSKPSIGSDESLKVFSVVFTFPNFPALVQLIIEKPWVLMKTGRGSRFLISDSPVTFSNDNGLGSYENIGFAVQDIEFYLPLSPGLQLALLCPSNIEKIRSSNDESKKYMRNAKAMLKLGQGFDRGRFERKIRETEDIERRIERQLANISGGLPITCEEQVVARANALQTAMAYRFVISRDGNFEFARTVLSEVQNAKDG